MRDSKTDPILSRPRVAMSVLLIFLAYLVYLPIHALSVEHCLPGVIHADGLVGVDLSDPDVPAGHPGHAHHEHPDGSHHQQHHAADDHEVETTGKVPGPEWMSTVPNGVSIRLLDPAELLVAQVAGVEICVSFFFPGHWLISRGPPPR